MNKNEIKKIACENIILVLDKLGVQFCQKGPLFQGGCPCKQHGGDGNNRTAFSWHEDINHWRCWTHSCHEHYGDDIIGLVRGVMDCSYKEAVKFLSDVIHGSKILYNGSKEKKPRIIHNRPLKEDLVRFLDYDNIHPFLLKRGFSQKVLINYQVGYWHRVGSFMHDRIIVPIRDEHQQLVGFSGRTIHPESEWSQRKIEAKWVHGRYYDRWSNHGEFLKTKILYNLCYCKVTARKANTMILVEGPFDGFKLQEAHIYNWCALLGTSFEDSQAQLLIQNGINNLVLAFDPDKAGDKLASNIIKQFGDIFNISHHQLEKEPGDMSVEEIHARFKNSVCV